ncbi:uncharacterized protein LOC124271923 [Haliotis rubra]|uniref:uncharacterized protein LOC124271923 n=1 Tax=Haliotis rubra TaxID=36100 RepID=UPI001EE5027B|nr:uncharacterized protein LOC124271923 [Haliotis rubra]
MYNESEIEYVHIPTQPVCQLPGSKLVLSALHTSPLPVYVGGLLQASVSDTSPRVFLELIPLLILLDTAQIRRCKSAPVLATNRRVPVEGVSFTITCTLDAAITSTARFIKGPTSVQGGCFSSGSCRTSVSGYTLSLDSASRIMSLDIASPDSTRDSGTWRCSVGAAVSNSITLSQFAAVLDWSSVTFSTLLTSLPSSVTPQNTISVTVTTPCAATAAVITWGYQQGVSGVPPSSTSSTQGSCPSGQVQTTNNLSLPGNTVSLYNRQVSLTVSVEHDSFDPPTYTKSVTYNTIQFLVPVSSVTLANIGSDNEEIGREANQSLTLTCVTSASFPISTVTWVTLPSGTSPTVSTETTSGVLVKRTSSVTFTVSRSDQGKSFRCQAENINGQTSPLLSIDQSQCNTAEMKLGPEQVDMTKPDSNVTLENSNLTLTCGATGYPNLTFTWDYNSQLQAKQRQGKYPPRALPSITQFPDVMSEGDPQTISCSVTGGNPLATITWSCPGTGSASKMLLEKDHINSPAQSPTTDTEGSERQHYTQLKVYENTSVDAKPETSTYEDMTETPPIPYESISASPYQNSGSQPEGFHQTIDVFTTGHVSNLMNRIRDMTNPTSFVMDTLHAGLMMYVIGIVITGVQSQLTSPVIVRESETASFRWQVPAVSGGFTVMYVISPSGAVVLLANTLNNNQILGNYTARVTYTGNLTADPKAMAFDLRSVVRSDAGTYICGYGGVSDIIPQCGQKLVVLGQPTKPTLSGPPSPVFGGQVTLTCSSTSVTVPADHGLTLTYTWQRDNTDITVTSTGSPYTFTVTSRDSHSYRCRARESQGPESEWSQVYNMEPQYGPYAVVLQPSTLSYTRREGQESVPSILCSITCKPACTYKWFKNGTSHSDGATLTLPMADRSQTGSYKCQASNTHGTVDSSSVSVDVTYAPEATLSPTCQPHSVYVGQPNAQLICQVTAANPAVTSYIWTHNGSPISPATSREYSLSPVSRSRGGSYTCAGRNSVGTSSVSAVTVEVQYKPTVSVPQSTPVRESQTLNITCSVDANPVAAVAWTKKDDSSFTPQTGSTLTINNIRRSQAGTYVCTASNTLSPCVGISVVRSDSVEVTVDVQYPADISMFTANSHSGSVTVNESDTVTLSCQIDSNPRSVITLLNGTEAFARADNSLTKIYRLEPADCRQRGNYSCTATNNIGAPVTQRVELLVKCSPRLDDSVSQQLKYAATLVGDVTLSVSVLAYPLPTFTWSRSISTSQYLTGSSSPVTDISVTARLHLTNLQQQDFGDYYLTVDNIVGGSATYTVSVLHVGPPQTPTQFRDLDNATTSSIWLYWLPGFNGGRTQTFVIEYLQFATRTWTVYKSYDDPGEVMAVEVTGLIPGEIYIFRLQARNDYGDSHGNVLTEAVTAGDPPDQLRLEASCISTGVTAGATVGGILLTLLIGGIVLMVLYRKGYRFGNILKGAARKSSSHPDPVEMDNRGYSSLDQITAPSQYSNVEEESEKQQYTQLKIYENTKADAAADTSTYESVTETPPVTYESIRASPYQNTGEHSQGPDK